MARLVGNYPLPFLHLLQIVSGGEEDYRLEAHHQMPLAVYCVKLVEHGDAAESLNATVGKTRIQSCLNNTCSMTTYHYNCIVVTPETKSKKRATWTDTCTTEMPQLTFRRVCTTQSLPRDRSIFPDTIARPRQKKNREGHTARKKTFKLNSTQAQPAPPQDHRESPHLLVSQAGWLLVSTHALASFVGLHNSMNPA